MTQQSETEATNPQNQDPKLPENDKNRRLKRNYFAAAIAIIMVLYAIPRIFDSHGQTIVSMKPL